jgi:hypothetical protein
MASTASATSASRNQIAPLGAAGPQPAGQLAAGGGVLDDDGFQQRRFPGEEQLTAGLGRGDRRGRRVRVGPLFGQAGEPGVLVRGVVKRRRLRVMG